MWELGYQNYQIILTGKNSRISSLLFYVVKDTNFAFHYAVCKDLTVENEKVQASKLKGFIHDTLEAALREFGIGAKTSVGYGHFIKSDQGETGKK